MRWTKPKQYWSSDGARHRYQTRKGYIIVAPLRPRRLRKGFAPPKDAPAWLVQNLFVDPQYRGEGYGCSLLGFAAERLVKLEGGPVRLGLYGELIHVPRRTTDAAKGCWAKWLAQQGLDAEDFVLIGGDA